ncbi:triphosphoribosyl-dephospho-CoA synthase [Mesorhizobium sp. LHD-90]|uniref:triphosphoribosyl-dephospho-CoA synthase n=1 Tax=Mesorhizobium sp. LHD-90 TaxID=3071414 RepID=UPI0027DF22AC|nr:triphosphoribosyl-dephospho-CoA synthase [Mesorhizobium sp. LHD-90]MDQ6438251.1 triphosphoribosyl-dephospho-CoA synthase [Mesorhizobium sp. LHD-90]
MPLSREALRAAYEDACRLEIEALKPGNVHVFADGHRMSAAQFLESARVSSGPLTDPALPVGRRMLEAVRATRHAVATNTNLGIVLLCGPLLRAAELTSGDLRADLGSVLARLDMDDTRAVFEAIVAASPGGLGSAGDNDVREEPKTSLVEAMREAAERDLIARQYATGFSDIFEVGLPAIEASRAAGETGMWPAIRAYMAFLTRFPDSHVARKHGDETAREVREEAVAFQASLDATAGEQARIKQLAAFDADLKKRGINPGTSADLTVACLLVHIAVHQLA